MSNYYKVQKVDGMDILRSIFPTGEADYMNFCLFSTSGVHGSYWTIEDAERNFLNPEDGENNPVTFLIIKPRIVSVIYGNCTPQSQDDFDFLKKLRASSKSVVLNGIG